MRKVDLLAALSLGALAAIQEDYAMLLQASEGDAKRTREAQEELDKEYYIAEYKLIQQKQSKLSSAQRRAVVMICEKRFTKEELI